MNEQNVLMAHDAMTYAKKLQPEWVETLLPRYLTAHTIQTEDGEPFETTGAIVVSGCQVVGMLDGADTLADLSEGFDHFLGMVETGEVTVEEFSDVANEVVRVVLRERSECKSLGENGGE